MQQQQKPNPPSFSFSFLQAEKAKTAGKNLGKVGVTSFKSRSFAEWQKAGGKNLFPVDPKKVKDPKDVSNCINNFIQ